MSQAMFSLWEHVDAERLEHRLGGRFDEFFYGSNGAGGVVVEGAGDARECLVHSFSAAHLVDPRQVAQLIVD